MTLLCRACANKLEKPGSFCPEQVESRSLTKILDSSSPDQLDGLLDPEESNAFLIDGFGRPHILCSRKSQLERTTYTIGRDPSCDISISEGSISRVHACLEYRARSGAWFVTDRDSSNGTTVNGRLIKAGTAPIDSLDRVRISAVGFFFRELEPDELPSARQLLRRLGREQIRQTEKRSTHQYSLLSIEHHHGQYVAMAWTDSQTSVEIALTDLEAGLLALFLRKAKKQAHFPRAVRGFVSATEIVESDIPFATPYPDRDNIKSLIRRIRRKFLEYDVGDVIESNQGKGYRLAIRDNVQ